MKLLLPLVALFATLFGCSPLEAKPELGTSAAPIWKKHGRLQQARVEPVVWVLDSTHVLVAGGTTKDESVLSGTEVWDMVSGASKTLASLTLPYLSQQRTGPGFQTDTVIFAFSADAKLWSFSKSESVWQEQTLVLGTASEYRLAPLGGNQFAICGVEKACRQLDASDPKPIRWRLNPMGELSTAHMYRMLVPFAGTVVALGGQAEGAVTPSTTAEMWDVSSKSWKRLKDMPNGRGSLASAIEIPGERLLVVGGRSTITDGDGGLTSTAFYYDLKKADWFPADNKASLARSHGRLFKLNESQIAWVGGNRDSSNGGGVVDVYNTKTTEFERPPTKLAVERYGGVAVEMPGGQIVVLGGVIGAKTDNYVLDVEVFDPAGTIDLATGLGLGPGGTPIATGDATACTQDSQCKSGHCADGVCCDTACKETCHSCALPRFPGICTLEPAGVDLRAECGIAGGCVGTCGPTGACVSASTGSLCRLTACTSRTKGTSPGLCAAAKGTCSASVEFDCAPYVCDPALRACKGRCVSSDDCAAGSLCDIGKGLCGPAPTSSDDSGCAVVDVGQHEELPWGAILGGLVLVGLFGRLRRTRS